MAENFDGTLITLQDEDGVEQEFEHIDTVEYNGSAYIALVPVYADAQKLLDADGELVILKVVTDENGEDMLESIEDDEEYDNVADLFEDRLQDEFELRDEE